MQNFFKEYVDEGRIVIAILTCCAIAIACGEPYKSQSKIWIGKSAISTKGSIAIVDVDVISDRDMRKKVRVKSNDAFSDAMAHYFSAAGWSVIERSRMEKILQEASFQQSGLIDKNTAAKLGKLTGAKYLLLATGLGKMYKGTYYLSNITIKIIDVESGENAMSLTNGDIRKELMEAANDIGEEIVDAFTGVKKIKEKE